MGETDEFVPQSSHVEDETAQEPAAEESAVPMTDEPAEPIVEQPETAGEPTDQQADDPIAGEPDVIPDAVPDAVAEPDSFDDIAPTATTAAAVSHTPEPSAVIGQVSWWPFVVYLGAWVVLAAAAVWQLLKLPADQVVYESTAYVLTILGGLIMTATGPLLILAVWLGTRANRASQEREGLLTSALMKGALVTLGGAIIWWASLVTIDYLRLGRLL